MAINHRYIGNMGAAFALLGVMMITGCGKETVAPGDPGTQTAPPQPALEAQIQMVNDDKRLPPEAKKERIELLRRQYSKKTDTTSK